MADSILDLSECGTTTIFSVKPDWSSLPKITYNFGREVQQYDSASLRYRSLTSLINWKVSYLFSNLTKADECELLTFFANRKGRLERFWLPVEWNYFSPGVAINSGDFFFYLKTTSYFNVATGRDRVFFVLNSGEIITREIASVDCSDNTKCVVSSVFDRNIALSDIAIAGKLILCRFDQDEIIFAHENLEVSSASLRFIELSQEYA